MNDIVLRYVVAKRVEKLRPDHVRSRRHLRVRQRIEFQQVQLPGRVPNAKSRRDAAGLGADDLPCSFHGRGPIGAGAPDQLFNAQGPGPDPVREPSRVVWRFSQGVHRLRGNERRRCPPLFLLCLPFPRLSERVFEEVIDVIQFPGL